MNPGTKLLAACAAISWAASAAATPSTTYWAPSTTYVQPFLVPHVTYDTYFWRGAVAGQAGSPLYPVDTGLTMGILPFEKLNLEVGFDLFLPSPDPLQLNAKLGLAEGALFAGSPSLAAGIYGFGTKASSGGVPGTDFRVLYGQLQKSLPWGGYLSAGGYYGAGPRILWLGSDGAANRAGFMGGVAAPDWNVNLPGLKKVVLVGDVQTGKNVFGAGGPGVYLYFTDDIDVLTGPVWFFDRALQPGGRDLLWTVQLDVDVRLSRK
jgi:hypothetical protein